MTSSFFMVLFDNTHFATNTSRILVKVYMFVWIKLLEGVKFLSKPIYVTPNITKIRKSSFKSYIRLMTMPLSRDSVSLWSWNEEKRIKSYIMEWGRYKTSDVPSKEIIINPKKKKLLEHEHRWSENLPV